MIASSLLVLALGADHVVAGVALELVRARRAHTSTVLVCWTGDVAALRARALRCGRRVFEVSFILHARRLGVALEVVVGACKQSTRQRCTHGQPKTDKPVASGLVFAPIHTVAPVYGHAAQRGAVGLDSPCAWL